VVAPGFLTNPKVRRWLNGVEPCWTLLKFDSYRALHDEPSARHQAIRLEPNLTQTDLSGSAATRNALLVLRRAADKDGLALTATSSPVTAPSQPSSASTASRARSYWKLGPPTLAGQHAPTPLQNGNILISDNGVHRLDDPLPFSRVIEINPATNEIVWTYQDTPVSNFFSPRMGNAQRLPNGNTLINEASFGRFFEVARDGEIVWEYVNPFFGGPPRAETNEVFRALRYSAEEIARAEAMARA
jgi:Arylsulfotransferase (ASST)